MDTLDPIKLYFTNIGKIPPTTKEEVEFLIPKIRNCCANAKKRMIEGNLRLVIPIARKYHKPGVSFSDLIEEGNLGLIRAIEKFDINRRYRFSTYATFWIAQRISRYVSSQLKTIKIPEHIMAQMKKWLKEYEFLKQKLGRIPIPEETAKKLKLTSGEIAQLLKNLELSKTVISLDMKIDEDESVSLSDIISDNKNDDPVTLIKYLKITNQIKVVLKKLTPKEKKIIILRFGLDTGIPCTLEKVGKKMNLSRERIRQIEAMAFRKIKNAVMKLQFLKSEEM
ncbi:MAG: RNA polymerase sigma factor RpoD/SigA [Elusimicrobiota bacterium]